MMKSIAQRKLKLIANRYLIRLRARNLKTNRVAVIRSVCLL
jgi:hypothetical protein